MSLLSPNLIAFEAIIKAKTVHGAAKLIGLTQTGVTQRIRALERDLNTTLFIRSRRGMQLTSEGEALYRYCQAALSLEGEAYGHIMGAGNKTELYITITGPTSIMSSRIIPQCSKLTNKYPNLLFRFIVNDLENRIENLRTGHVQLAVVPPHVVSKEMDSKVLKPEKFSLVCSKKWKNRKLKEILSKERIIDFDETDDTTYSYLRSFSLLGHVSKSRHFVNENASLIEMFSDGIGYGTLNSEIASRYIKEGKISSLNNGKTFQQEHALAWYPRTEMPTYFEDIVSCIK
tara:strand:+ start:922 stop:1785 length:864 start_codon:yes stop_codon:yes gene_type:complete